MAGGTGDKVKEWCWAFLLILLALVGLWWYFSPSHTPSHVLKYDTMDCDFNTTTDEQELFSLFTSGFKKEYSNHTMKCRAFATFVSHARMELKCEHGNRTTEFALNLFADWPFEKRAERAGPPMTDSFLDSLDSFQIDWTIGPRPAKMMYPNHGIQFYDDCGLAWNIRWVLSRLEEYGLYETLTIKWTPSDWNATENDTCTGKNGNLLSIREVMPGRTFNKTSSSQILETWIRIYGPFVTTIAVPEQFFEYSSGVFSKCECDHRSLFAPVHVVVLGYGIDELSGLRYWTIWPIGETWKRADWGEAGTMKLEMGACVPDGINLKMVVPIRDKQSRPPF